MPRSSQDTGDTRRVPDTGNFCSLLKMQGNLLKEDSFSGQERPTLMGEVPSKLLWLFSSTGSLLSFRSSFYYLKAKFVKWYEDRLRTSRRQLWSHT